MRTMRDVWDERRKSSPSRTEGTRIVRRLGVTRPATRHRPPKGAKPLRAWVFSRRPADGAPERQLLVKRTKEPEVDLFDEESELIVLADLPGVSEQDIQTNVEKDLLTIEAISAGPQGEVHYYKEVVLPYEVRKDFDRSSKSGVLEVHLRPKRRTRRRTKTTKGKSRRAARAGQPSKKKEARSPNHESGENKEERKAGSGRRKTRQRKS